MVSNFDLIWQTMGNQTQLHPTEHGPPDHCDHGLPDPTGKLMDHRTPWPDPLDYIPPDPLTWSQTTDYLAPQDHDHKTQPSPWTKDHLTLGLVNRITHTAANITFPRTTYAVDNKAFLLTDHVPECWWLEDLMKMFLTTRGVTHSISSASAILMRLFNIVNLLSK